MKFKVGDLILRARRKVPRYVIAVMESGYVLSDSCNYSGSVWLNTYVVESQYKLVKEQ